MVEIDLVTGFLGAGKTAFLTRYGAWLTRQGVRFAVVENEFGAAGVDSACLSERFGNVRELSGGCICCTLKSGFYLLLEELCGHCGRILVEPSGLYNPDDFFDVTDTLEARGAARPGLFLTLVDPHVLPLLGEDEWTVLCDELADSGCVLWTKADVPPACDLTAARGLLTDRVARAGLPGGLRFYDTPAHRLTEADFPRLQEMRPVRRAHARALRAHQSLYQSASLRPAGRFAAETAAALLSRVVADGSCGEIIRIKGFLNGPAGSLSVNATVSDCSAVPCAARPPLLNVIGRGLDRARLRALLDGIAE